MAGMSSITSRSWCFFAHFSPPLSLNSPHDQVQPDTQVSNPRQPVHQTWFEACKIIGTKDKKNNDENKRQRIKRQLNQQQRKQKQRIQRCRVEQQLFSIQLNNLSAIAKVDQYHLDAHLSIITFGSPAQGIMFAGASAARATEGSKETVNPLPCTWTKLFLYLNLVLENYLQTLVGISQCFFVMLLSPFCPLFPDQI